MANPALITLVADTKVLTAVTRDLRREFGQNYQILPASSVENALGTLNQLKLRNDPVALFLVDHGLPHMSGVEFLKVVSQLCPAAKRVLLAAYADTEIAIEAINSAQIDYYLLKPWETPQEQLYPVLYDLLDDWHASFQPMFEGLRVVGHHWCLRTYLVKDFLTRNQIPYRSFDIETNDDAQAMLAQVKLANPELPVIFFTDGSRLVNPTTIELAEKVGLKTRAARPFYDLAIVGSGPAGLAAAVYGASEGLKTVLIEREAPGGQAGTSSRIENYLGFPVGLSGADLARRAVAQARRFGVEIITPQEVCGLRSEGGYHFVKLADGSEISCHATLIATGVSYRKLAVPGIERLVGAGVYYGAAMTEAFSCKGEDVYIIGGANSAGQAAVYFSRYARKVTLVVRAQSLTESMSKYLIERIGLTNNIEVLPCTSVTEVYGTARLEALTLTNTQTGKSETVAASALFIFIGAMPRTDWLEGVVERDAQGFIPTGPDLLRNNRHPQSWQLTREPYLLEASVPGVFVAGDVRQGSVKRVASGVGEGAIAVQFIHRYLAEL